MMTQAEMIKYDQVVDMGICTADELNLAFNLIGNSWSDVIDKIIYIRTGYRDYDQYIMETMEDDDEEWVLPEDIPEMYMAPDFDDLHHYMFEIAY